MLDLLLVDASVADNTREEEIVSLLVSAAPQKRALQVYEACIDLAKAEHVPGL